MRFNVLIVAIISYGNSLPSKGFYADANRPNYHREFLFQTDRLWSAQSRNIKITLMSTTDQVVKAADDETVASRVIETLTGLRFVIPVSKNVGTEIARSFREYRLTYWTHGRKAVCGQLVFDYLLRCLDRDQRVALENPQTDRPVSIVYYGIIIREDPSMPRNELQYSPDRVGAKIILEIPLNHSGFSE